MRTNVAAKYSPNAPRTHEGALATPNPSALAQLKRSVMACMLWEDSFYEDGKAIAERIAELLKQVHVVLNCALFATACIHVGAALKHHFVDRDDVLARMLPLVAPRRREK